MDHDEVYVSGTGWLCVKTINRWYPIFKLNEDQLYMWTTYHELMDKERAKNQENHEKL